MSTSFVADTKHWSPSNQVTTRKCVSKVTQSFAISWRKCGSGARMLHPTNPTSPTYKLYKLYKPHKTTTHAFHSDLQIRTRWELGLTLKSDRQNAFLIRFHIWSWRWTLASQVASKLILTRKNWIGVNTSAQCKYHCVKGKSEVEARIRNIWARATLNLD